MLPIVLGINSEPFSVDTRPLCWGLCLSHIPTPLLPHAPYPLISKETLKIVQNPICLYIEVLLLAESLIVDTQSQEGHYSTFHNCRQSQVNPLVPV